MGLIGVKQIYMSECTLDQYYEWNEKSFESGEKDLHMSIISWNHNKIWLQKLTMFLKMQG